MSRLPIPFDNPTTYAGHSGIDFPVPRGTPIPASGAGRVTWLGWNPVGGYFIWVKYDEIAPKVGYHHMDSHNGCPKVGARVVEGTRLGYCGNSGHSTGPHVHSEVAGHRTTDGYWQFFDRNKVVGSSSGGNAAGSEDDMFTDDDRNTLKQVYNATFKGGPSMQEDGNSISASLAKLWNAVKPITRDGKPVALRQEIADTKTKVYALEAAVTALATSQGADPAAILRAVEDGVKEAMRDVSITVDVDG